MKKIMMLGGLKYLIPAIDAAHRQGYHVITCDYLPDNIAHRFSDEYHNVSITEKEMVLDLAVRLGIDGIMSFAVDPGVTTAAYVQDKMNLPGNPYESVCILQNKIRFRQFLADNGFNTPFAKGASSLEEAAGIIHEFKFPVIVKPADSAGSKGVSRIDDRNALASAFENAQKHSATRNVIIEEYIEPKGYPSDSDCLSIDGNLVFSSFSSQRFDPKASNPYTPAAFSWPDRIPAHYKNELVSELQRLISLLKMRTSIYNVETRIGTDGKAYIMEMSPRGGGNRIAEILRMATGIDLITAAVKTAVGDAPDGNIHTPQYNGHWAEVILHSEEDGSFQRMEISDEMQKHIKDVDLWVNKGDRIHAFNGANNTIGTLIMKFDSEEQLDSALKDQSSWLRIITEKTE